MDKHIQPRTGIRSLYRYSRERESPYFLIPPEVTGPKTSGLHPATEIGADGRRSVIHLGCYDAISSSTTSCRLHRLLHLPA